MLTGYSGTYLPTVLALKNGSISLSLKFTYRSYIAIYAPGIVGVVLGSLMYGVPQVGRKWVSRMQCRQISQ